jgi:1-acyl-sn-glycerol-3-phosphate acyltransferase
MVAQRLGRSVAMDRASPGLVIRRAATTAWLALRLFGRAASRSPAQRAELLSEGAQRLLAAHNILVGVRGALPSSPSVLVANHLGYLDPLVIASIVPCVPIAKAELGGWPLLGNTARRLGVLFVRRGNVASGARVLLAARRQLRSGIPVLAFPEGTTSRGVGVGRFLRGIFGLARLCNVPVVPIALGCPPDLCWIGEELFLPHYLRTAARRSSSMTVSFGHPLNPQAFPDALALAEEARRRVDRMLRRP